MFVTCHLCKNLLSLTWENVGSLILAGFYFKALVNEDTLLPTHCCPWCFLGCANWETFVADTECFWTKSETFLCPGHKICVRNKCCACGQTGKHLCQQQCVLVCQGLWSSSLLSIYLSSRIGFVLYASCILDETLPLVLTTYELLCYVLCCFGGRQRKHKVKKINKTTFDKNTTKTTETELTFN